MKLRSLGSLLSIGSPFPNSNYFHWITWLKAAVFVLFCLFVFLKSPHHIWRKNDCLQQNAIQMSTIKWLILFFSIWKTAFTRRKKTNRFFQNSPIFKSYKNLSLDLSRILFSEHQFYSPDVESWCGVRSGLEKITQTCKIQSSCGRMEEREDTALIVSGFQRMEFDWIQ